MNKKLSLILLFGGLLLTSCGQNATQIFVPTNKDEKDLPKNGHFYGGLVEGDKFSGYEFSKSKETIKKPTSGIGNINIFGINDFHGAIISDENHFGLAKLGTVIKQETAKENTLFLDQGDTWQGSLESNIEYGSIIQDVYNYAGATLRTVGNHDFDWGVEKLETLEAKTFEGNYTATLASNVFDYDWELKKEGTIQQKALGKDYATYVLDNGVKVGVVGVIGSNQITSICTQLVKNISFSDHNERIMEVSDFLRTEKKCDIVIASVHAYDTQCDLDELTSISPVSKERYVDLVLNGHAHSQDKYLYDGVLFAQWDSDGQTMGKINLKYDFSRNIVVRSGYEDCETFYPSTLKQKYPENDREIESMVSDYLAGVNEIGEQVLSTKFSGYFNQGETLPNLMAEAIYFEAHKQGFNVDYAVVNMARADFINYPIMIFSDLYRSFPFDNAVIVMEVSGVKARNSIAFNSCYHNGSEKKNIDSSETYTIACIDYVALHCDSDRDYDNFPNAVEKGILKKNGNDYIYREILKDYLIDNQDKTFLYSDYWNSKDNFSANYMY